MISNPTSSPPVLPSPPADSSVPPTVGQFTGAQLRDAMHDLLDERAQYLQGEKRKKQKQKAEQEKRDEALRQKWEADYLEKENKAKKKKKKERENLLYRRPSDYSGSPDWDEVPLTFAQVEEMDNDAGADTRLVSYVPKRPQSYSGTSRALVPLGPRNAIQVTGSRGQSFVALRRYPRMSCTPYRIYNDVDESES